MSVGPIGVGGVSPPRSLPFLSRVSQAKLDYQRRVPGAPLKGPRRLAVIHPP